MGIDAGVLEAISVAATVIGTGVSMAGAEQQAQSQQKTNAYNAQVALNNQSIALTQQQQAQATGKAQEETQGLKTRAQVGAIRAAQGASNIDVNTGSAVDVRSSAAELGELDALTIRSTAEKQAYGYGTTAAGFGATAGLDKAAGAGAIAAGNIGATSSLLTGASGVSNQYLKWQQSAGPGGSGGTTSLPNFLGGASSDASTIQPGYNATANFP